MNDPTQFLADLTRIIERHKQAFEVVDLYKTLVTPVINKEIVIIAKTIARVEKYPEKIAKANAPEHYKHAIETYLKGTKKYKETKIDNLAGLHLETMLVYCVSVYDATISDAIKVLLMANPMLLMNSQKEIKQDLALKLALDGTLAAHITENVVEDFAFKSVSDQLKILQDKYKLELELSDEFVKGIVEIIARRNLLVHAGGIVSRRYLKDVQNSYFKIGDKLGVDGEYFVLAYNILLYVGKSICESIQKALTPKIALRE